MSVKAIMEFYLKVEESQELKAKLEALDQATELSAEAAVEKLIEIANAEGHEFTTAEFEEVRTSEPPSDIQEIASTKAGVPYDCTAATAWKGHPPNTDPGCYVAWGCGMDHPLYSGPHIPKCATRPV